MRTRAAAAAAAAVADAAAVEGVRLPPERGLEAGIVVRLAVGA